MSPKESINEQLLKAACDGSTEQVSRCLSHVDCDPLDKDYVGRTALMFSAYYGHEECTRMLLPVSDALAKNKNEDSALMLAAENGQEACVRLLLPYSDALAVDSRGFSALMWAAVRGHEACMRLLLPESDPLTKDNDGFSASQLARECGHHALAEMIEVYIARKEAALLSTDVLPAPPRRTPVIRI